MSLAARSICRAPLRGHVAVLAGDGVLRRRLQQNQLSRPYSTTTDTTTRSTPPPPIARSATRPTTKTSEKTPPASHRKPGAAPSKARGRDTTRRERNNFFRTAFTQSPIEDVERKLGTALVPPARIYPSPQSTAESRHEALRHARTQAGLDAIWAQHKTPEHRVLHGLVWRDTLEQLRRSTARARGAGGAAKRMAAMRIVLPGNWDLDVSNRSVDFVDSVTGLRERLRVYQDQRDASAMVVRGHEATLAKAADELLGVCSAVKIYQLGEVAETDYETRQLWPAITPPGANPTGGDSSSTVPADKLGSVWVHREQPEEQWITQRYEDYAPRPAVWTSPAQLEAWVARVVGGRLRPHLALALYSAWSRERGRAGEQVDTNGVRVDMLMAALTDPATDARRHMTAAALNMALSHMSQRGGHRAAADRLFTLAEGWGVPMDTATFNIMLEGYVTKRDHRFFHLFLRKMRARYVAPNARTWLLLLRLVQADDARRDVVVAMYELGLFAHPAVPRGVAAVMSAQDAHAAFRSGRSLDGLLRDQAARYGAAAGSDAWLSRDALDAILREFLLFHGGARPDPATTYAPLLDAAARLDPHDGRPLIGPSTIDILLRHALRANDWPAALWTVSLAARASIDISSDAYLLLIRLCAASGRPHALAATVFHAAHEYKLRHHARRLLNPLILSGIDPGLSEYYASTTSSPTAVPPPTTASVPTRIPLLYDNAAACLAVVAGVRDPAKLVGQVLSHLVTSCRGMVPDQPLAQSLEAALALDSASGKSKDKAKGLEIKLHHPPSGTKGAICLDTYFDPASMLVPAPSKPRKREGASASRRTGTSSSSSEPGSGL